MLISLNCLLLGDDLNAMFTVKVPVTDNISLLKKLIKEERASRLKDVDAADLVLWEVDLPVENLGGINNNTVNKKPLSGFQKISKVFPNPDDNHFNVIIKNPSVGKPGKFSFGTCGGKTLKLTAT
jgi:hypothetical protein